LRSSPEGETGRARGVGLMNREEALTAFAAFVPDKWDHKSVVLPAELLEHIVIDDVPFGVPVEIGTPFKKSMSDFPIR
jgi:hypothetical protein